MSEIRITRRHDLPPEQARAAAEQMARGLRKKHGLDYQWADDERLCFRGPGVQGELAVECEQVTVVVSLGFFLAPFKGVLEQEIHEYFDERFGTHA
jgi:putative polyhydroxyalkanoate system protein